VREWNKGGDPGALLGLYLNSCAETTEFLVLPLPMGPVRLSQGRFKEPVRPCYLCILKERDIECGNKHCFPEMGDQTRNVID